MLWWKYYIITVFTIFRQNAIATQTVSFQYGRSDNAIDSEQLGDPNCSAASSRAESTKLPEEHAKTLRWQAVGVVELV
jgi:hypothetical protein